MTDAETVSARAAKRDDGSVGVRDRILILPSVICSHIVAERIADRVSDAVAAPHDHGCAQLGADVEQTMRTFRNLAANPNVAGTVIVGLGCETVQSDDVSDTLKERDVPVREVAIQDVGGTDECIEAGLDLARELVADRTMNADIDVPLSDLTVGVVTSDLRDSTTDVAEPIVGDVVEDVVEAGGRVIVGGTERFLAHPDATRVHTAPEAAEDLHALLDRHQGRRSKVTRVRRTAANRSIESLTDVLGDRQIEEVVRYGERASLSDGVALLDAPSEFAEAATGLVAAGANVIVHVTADGVTTGHPLVPVLKVSGDETAVAALPNDIDVNAREATPRALRERILAVANGDRCCAEAHGVTEFAITRVGPSM